MQRAESAGTTDEPGQVTEETDAAGEPAFKRFRYLSSVVSEKLRQASSQPRSPPLIPGRDDLEKYLHEEVRLSEDSEPLDYWRNNELKYPTLSVLALDLLVIPASSAPIERVFSTAGQISSGKRNRLSDINLEREILVKKNKRYL